MMLARLAHLWKARKTERSASQVLARSLVRAAPFALLIDSRKTERGASQFPARLAVRAAPFALLTLIASMTHLAVAQSLDYESYKKTVEPIFVKKRVGHARCVACHSASNNAFRLQPLAEGGSWTEEQSRRNFESVSKLVNAANPKASLLLKHPLAHEAGGDEFHSGGRQFLSKDDPDWKAIAVWAGVTE